MDFFGYYIDLDAQWFVAFVGFLGTLLGALIVVWQVGRQFRYSLELQKQNHRDELFLEIYKLLASQIETAQEEIIKANGLYLIPSQIDFYWKKKLEWNLNPEPIEERMQSVHSTHFSMIKIANQVVFILERYEITVPYFDIFKRMILRQFRSIDEVFSKYSGELYNFLPMETFVNEIRQTVVPGPPTPEKLQHLRNLAEQYSSECVNLLAYFRDLGIEAQNQLLGGLFNRTVPARAPQDPKQIVIKTDQKTIEKLEKILEDFEKAK
ncbi:MAG: hypothetical protein AB7P69_01185 [Candidatus Binatia bacterium]